MYLVKRVALLAEGVDRNIVLHPVYLLSLASTTNQRAGK